MAIRFLFNPNGVVARPVRVGRGATPLGLKTFWIRLPKVARRTKQPWAGGRNPVGIGANQLQTLDQSFFSFHRKQRGTGQPNLPSSLVALDSHTPLPAFSKTALDLKLILVYRYYLLGAPGPRPDPPTRSLT